MAFELSNRGGTFTFVERPYDFAIFNADDATNIKASDVDVGQCDGKTADMQTM